VRNVSLLVAISVNAEGYREILGIVEGEGGQGGLERLPEAPQGPRAGGHWAISPAPATFSLPLSSDSSD
jgi:hypothetical protein